jgi:hypothetical protein
MELLQGCVCGKLCVEIELSLYERYRKSFFLFEFVGEDWVKILRIEEL